MSKVPSISGTFLDKVLRLAQLTSVLALIFTIGVTWGQSQEKMFDNPNQKSRVISHSDEQEAGYYDDHMTLKEGQKEFATRREYILLLKGQDEIKTILREQYKK